LDSINHPSSLWTQSQVQPDHTYLFNHVQKFFSHNQELQSTIDENQALLFELKSKELQEEEKDALLLFNNLFKRDHWIEIEGLKINFSLLRDNSILSPKILFVPLTGVGILSFGIKLKDHCQELSHLLQLNYHLRVLSRGKVQTINTGKNLHPNAAEQENRISEKLELIKEAEAGEENFTWSIKTLINYLLSDLKKEITVLSSSRLQAFVYTALEDELDDKDLAVALFRLRRLYSENYVPTEEFIKSGIEVFQSLQKIYYGATVEGAVVLVKPDDTAFFKNYSQTVTARTLWTYILAYHQRTALIAAAEDTASLYADNIEPTTSELSHLIDKISKVQLKCLFEEISHYSQQNDFYHLCFRNLNIDSLFREVKEEVEEINKILSEKWRELEEKHKLEEEQRARRNQRKLEILITLLIVPQIWFAILSTNIETWQDFLNANTTVVTIFNSVIWVVIIGIVVRLFLMRRK